MHKTNRTDLHEVGKLTWKFDQDICAAMYELCANYLQQRTDDEQARAQAPQEQLIRLLLAEAVESLYTKFERARFAANGTKIRLTIVQQAAVLYLLENYQFHVLGSVELIDKITMQFTRVTRKPLEMIKQLN